MTEPRTKIFGMDLGVDPKIIVLALIVLAGVVYYFTSSSSASSSSTSAAPMGATTPIAKPVVTSAAARAPRRAKVSVDRDTLKFVPVDGSSGDVDPTLRLSLLERVKNVPPAAGLRNLFDSGNPMMVGGLPPVPAHPPIMTVKPTTMPIGPQPAPPMPMPTAFTIPLKYYGFAKSRTRPLDGNRGLFLDGDNILIGGEGDTLEKRFLIVALTPTSARLEDIQAKQRQDLPVTPEAPSAQ